MKYQFDFILKFGFFDRVDDKSIFDQLVGVDKKSYIRFGDIPFMVWVVVHGNDLISVMLKKTRGAK